MKEKILSFKYLDILLLFVISIVVYLPLAHGLGYIKDDWYLMYAAHTQGPAIFHDIFAIDRPARGVLLAMLYPLFGNNPYPYSLSAWGFRLLSAISFLFLARGVWAKQRMPTLVMAILFLVYPGYLSQVNAIDFQAHVVSLFFAILSIHLSIKAIRQKSIVSRIWMSTLSVLLGWSYLALVEYAIGLEIFRITVIAVILLRGSTKPLAEKIKALVQQAWVFFIIPVGFLFWRVFLFQNERKATDLVAQTGQIITSPLAALWAGVRLLQDTLNVTFLAWGVPLYDLGFQTRLREAIAGMILALVILAVIKWLYASHLFETTERDEGWQKEAFWLGLIVVVTALLPVVLVNRHFTFEEYSRYGLPAATGGIFIIVSILFSLKEKGFRAFLAYTLIFIATVTHYANAAIAVRSTESLREFWWQVSWRAPQIEEGTTLVAHYAESSLPEDYVLWGPANFIFYPERKKETPIQLPLSAVILDYNGLTSILAEANANPRPGRGNIQDISYKDILVISQPSPESCVHFYDRDMTVFSVFENSDMMMVASKSDGANILTDGDIHIPQESVFGAEPRHTWCYYYQKASLARQKGEWEAVINLFNAAAEQELQPNDQIELMPFLQAFAYLGDKRKVKQLSTRINTETYYQYQACQVLREMAEGKYPLSSEMDAHVNKLFCKGAE